MDTSVLEQSLVERIDFALNAPLIRIGANSLTLGAIVKILGAIFLVLVITLGVKRLLAQVVLERLGLKEGTRESVATIASYGLGAFFLVVVLQAVGLNLATLTVLAGSLGVGIGFGLQDITRDFISGLTLLLEQKLKVGDFIEWEGKSGYVAEISLRSTVIRTLTLRHIIIPNSSLMGNQVLNWTYNSHKGWVSLPVSVMHESDPIVVIEVLMDSAYLEESVSFEYPPEVYFTGFSDHALEFSLWVWVHRIDRKHVTESALRFIVEQNLRQHGIKLASPRMNIWQRNPNVLIQASSEDYRNLAHLQQPESSQVIAHSRPISTRDLLWQISYFKNCTELELKKLVELGFRRHLRAGEILFAEGDPGDAFYIILAGKLTYQIKGLNQPPVTLEAGSFAGEFSLMLGIPRTVTVRAVEPTAVFSMSPQGFNKLLHDQPHLYDLMVEEMGQHQDALSQQKRQLHNMGMLKEEEYDANPVAWIRKRLEKLFYSS
ncbi:mechanosensitive ion channel protein MscS [filamentous cyanobacterium CCP5]|nr:mechanosensitive ion channel protein MscS [filamentous cyanobacterium CCP5]